MNDQKAAMSWWIEWEMKSGNEVEWIARKIEWERMKLAEIEREINKPMNEGWAEANEQVNNYCNGWLNFALIQSYFIIHSNWNWLPEINWSWNSLMK